MHLPLLDVKQVAERLAVSNRSVQRLIASGSLTVVRIGGCLRVKPEDLEEFINRNRHCAAPLLLPTRLHVITMRTSRSPTDELNALLGTFRRPKKAGGAESARRNTKPSKGIERK